MERVARIELATKPWQGLGLPLHHTREFGAASGNRTRVLSLEGFDSAIELPPHGALGLNRTDSHGLQNRWFTINRQGRYFTRPRPPNLLGYRLLPSFKSCTHSNLISRFNINCHAFLSSIQFS